MIIKYLNSVSAWLLTVVMCGHLGLMCRVLFCNWYDAAICKPLSTVTMIIFIIHTSLSLWIVFMNHEGATITRYGRENLRVGLQRGCALVVIALLHVHVQFNEFIIAGTGLTPSAKAWYCITEVLFFVAIFIHVGVSFSRSLIGCGLVRTVKAEQTVDRICWVVCGLLCSTASIAIVRFVCMWVGRGGA